MRQFFTYWRTAVFLGSIATLVFAFQNFSPVDLEASRPALPDGDCPASGGYMITSDPSVKTDGSVDVSGAFQKAIDNFNIRTICIPAGVFLFSKNVIMPADRMINIKGLNPADISSTVIQFHGTTIPFHSNTLLGKASEIILFRAQNLTFDGSATKETFQQSLPSTRAMSLIASQKTDTLVELNNVHLKNMNNLPVWFEGFTTVRVLNSRFSKTKDPGVLRAKSVVFSHNVVEDTYDNCLSVSRGNSNVRISYNKLRNCGGAGIFVGGIAYDGNWNTPPGRPRKSIKVKARKQGALAVGDSCEITASESYFRSKMISTLQTVKSSDPVLSDFAIVELTEYISPTQMNCRLLTPLSPKLNDAFSDLWIDGPHYAGQNVQIVSNEISGSSQYGIKLSMAPRGVSVTNNFIENSGVRHDPFDQKIVSRTDVFGIVVLGWYLAADENAHRYAEGIHISNNRIINPVYGGVRLGSNLTGSVRDVSVFDNEIEFSASSGTVGIMVDGIEAMQTSDSKTRAMPTSALLISNNRIHFGKGIPGQTTYLNIQMGHGEFCQAIRYLYVESAASSACALSLLKNEVGYRADRSYCAARGVDSLDRLRARCLEGVEAKPI